MKEELGKIIKLTGNIIKVLGIISLSIFGLWSFSIEMNIVISQWGFLGAVVWFAIAPIAAMAVPVYAIFAWGSWGPALVMYGGTLFSLSIFGIGSLMTYFSEKLLFDER